MCKANTIAMGMLASHACYNICHVLQPAGSGCKANAMRLKHPRWVQCIPHHLHVQQVFQLVVPGWPQAPHAGQQQLASNYTLLNLHHTQHTTHRTRHIRSEGTLFFEVQGTGKAFGKCTPLQSQVRRLKSEAARLIRQP